MSNLTAIAITNIWDDILQQTIISDQIFEMSAARVMSLVAIGAAYLQGGSPNPVGLRTELFTIGSTEVTGTTSLRLQKNSGRVDLIANPTGQRVITLPDEDGTIALLSDLTQGAGVYLQDETDGYIFKVT
jgi:hypothetical protein